MDGAKDSLGGQWGRNVYGLLYALVSTAIIKICRILRNIKHGIQRVY